MCGRFGFDISDKEIEDMFGEAEKVSGIEIPLKKEIAPTNLAPVLVRKGDTREAHAMAWGFPKWKGTGVVFNARAETALEKSMFAKSLRERPAVIPTSGFFEWQDAPGQKRKPRFIFTDPNDKITWLAGFWNTYREESGLAPERFVILTTDANQGMAPYHDRMPITLERNEIQAWLDGTALMQVLERVPPRLDVAPA